MNDDKKLHIDINIKEFNIDKGLFDQDFGKEICDDIRFIPFSCIKINTMKQLHSLFLTIFELEKQGCTFLYRGQSNSDWFLESTLAREAHKYNIPVGRIEGLVFNSFRKKLRGNLIDQSLLNITYTEEDIRELWAIGRHNDLKTPFLDWSLSIYVALFMAYAEPRNINELSEYSSLFIIDGECFSFPNCFVNPYIFTPKTDYYRRITAQKGYLSTEKFIEKLIKFLDKKLIVDLKYISKIL